MVRCPDCETPNSVDSKFCRFCGAPLPEEERIDAQMKLNELIAEGNKLFNDGRTDEALLIAESAISSSPNDTRALSLKGMCLERAGDLADALELYERVVELNPDSALDKIKVTHVRNRLAAKVAEPPRAESTRRRHRGGVGRRLGDGDRRDHRGRSHEFDAKDRFHQKARYRRHSGRRIRQHLSSRTPSSRKSETRAHGPGFESENERRHEAAPRPRSPTTPPATSSPFRLSIGSTTERR